MVLTRRNIASYQIDPTEATSATSATSAISAEDDKNDAESVADTEHEEPEEPPGPFLYALVYGLIGLVFGGFCVYIQQTHDAWHDMVYEV